MLVYTIKELCRTCYTCVRECPAKAIRIVGGQRMQELDKEKWQMTFDEYSKLDLSLRHRPEDRHPEITDEEGINEVLASMGKITEKDRLDCGACGYESCFEHAIAIKKGLAKVEMCLPYIIEKLHKSVKELALSNEKLSSMRQALKLFYRDEKNENIVKY